MISRFPRKRENDGEYWLSDLALCHLQPKAGDPVSCFLDSRASARMTENIGFQTLTFRHLQPKAGDPVG